MLVSHVCFSLVFFVSLFEKTWDTCISKFSYLMIWVHVEISNICSLLLCVSGNAGCAGVACLFHFCIFFVYFEKNLSYMHLKTFISHDWGSCWHCKHLFFVALSLGNGSCASVTERRQLHIFFALCLPACGSLCDFRPHLYVSFVGLYALWLVFNTVSAYIFKAAFSYAR